MKTLELTESERKELEGWLGLVGLPRDLPVFRIRGRSRFKGFPLVSYDTWRDFLVICEDEFRWDKMLPGICREASLLLARRKRGLLLYLLDRRVFRRAVISREANEAAEAGRRAVEEYRYGKK
jgi:hypothetical protein